MLVFELTMPNVGSWDNRWTGERDRHILVRSEKFVSKEMLNKIVGNTFIYNFLDGWTACISVSKMVSSDANKLLKKSSGFCGYDWMADSICKIGEIRHG